MEFRERVLDLVVGLVLATVALATACGGDGTPASPSSSTGGGTGTPSTATITMTGGGVDPRGLTVAPGSRVTFVNNDTRGHDIASDPHPSHTDCPELNQVGLLQPGQSRTSGNLNTVRTCGFHDHEQPTNAALRGTIIIR